MDVLVGRLQEISRLKEAKTNIKSELIVIYGRRRVGKTFLVREYFKKEIVFEITGLYQGVMRNQIANFSKELIARNNKLCDIEPDNWLDAFTMLEAYLDRLRSKKKKVVFIDEFPWIATRNSKFLMAFESFWNQYATKRDDLIVVICGSAASYMVNKIIQNKGGLHNRITRKIKLLPFDLNETRLYLRSRGIEYTSYDIIQIYMAIGGIPHYLEKLKRGRSVSQNLDQLCFQKDGVLRTEFDQLFASLFDDSAKHIKIIEVLAKMNKGMPRSTIIKMSKISSGGDMTLKLNELVESGFISEYSYFNNKKKNTLYRLTDEYSLFYLKFIKPARNTGIGYWQRMANSRSYNIWSGFIFETLCLKHILQIKMALGISGVYSTTSSWFNENAQIDLLIDRDDKVINICELKFHSIPFAIDKKYYQSLRNKVSEFVVSSKTRKNTYLTVISTYGLRENAYSNELVQNSLDMDCLFLEV